MSFQYSPGMREIALRHDEIVKCANDGMLRSEAARCLGFMKCGSSNAKGSFLEYCRIAGIQFRTNRRTTEQRTSDQKALAVKRRERFRQEATQAGVTLNKYLVLTQHRKVWNMMIQRSRVRAKRKGMPHDLTSDYLRKLFAQQGGRCLLTGWDLTITGGAGEKYRDSASIDRIIPHLGYVQGNVRFVALAANAFRMTKTDDELFALCEAILEHKKQHVLVRGGAGK